MSKPLLHLVFGGRVKDPVGVDFADPDKLDIVGIFPNYASALKATRNKTERPRAPLLQLGIEFWDNLCRIGGRRRSPDASSEGANLEIPP